jgi:hypothetical protein
LYTLTSDLFKLFTGTKAPTAHIVGTGQNPFAGHADALTAGCATTSDLNSVSYATDEQKQKLCEAGGFVNSMYRQDAIDPTYKSGLNASDPTQQWDQTITNDQPVAPNSNAFAARVEAAGDYMNCTLLPAGYQGTAFPNGECNQNWAGTTSGLTAGGWNCDTSVPAQSVPGLIDSTLAQQKVNNWYYNCPNATANAWQQCANDVIATAKRSCVDPLFALLLWIHESGASNYQCGRLVTGGIPVEDFGIHSGNPQWPPENFSAQLDKFVLKPTEYVGLCPNLTFQNFMSLYAKGHCYNDLSQADKASVDNLINVDYKNLYEWFAPGVPLPTAWPGISDCTPG